MSAHGFKSLYMAAGVAGAALGCYLVSLNVASERSKLEAVEAEIASTQRDIRVLQTEIGTRGRLAQLERWNANFIRLSAPAADQFLEGGFQLATMIKPKDKPTIEAPVVLAAAPADQSVGQARPAQPRSDSATASPSDMMHVVSYKRPEPAAMSVAPPKPAAPLAKAAPLKKAQPAGVKASSANSAKTALVDDLAPLPAGKRTATPAVPGKAAAKPKASPKPKDSGTPQ